MIHDSLKIVFFGTPDFAVIVLQKLIEANIPPVAVVTAPDKPAGRGHLLKSPPIKVLAEIHHIPILQPDKLDSSFMLQVSSFKPDAFVIAAYGKILPQALLAIPPKGTINIHPSLLPRHRGPSPIQGAILAGDAETGVTLMLTDEKMDHGPILAQYTHHITHNTYQELHDELAQLSGTLLVKTLPKWISGEIKPQEQDHKKATYTKLLTKEDGHIDWSKPAEEIDRMVRALNPWPGTWSYLKIPEAKLPEFKRVKILAGHPLNERSSAKPGTLIKTKNGHLAVCAIDFLYKIERLQLEGKKSTNSTYLSIEESRVFQLQ